MKKCLLFSLFFISLFSVYAATYTVTTAAFGTTADGISLRWAVNQANTNPGADLINFNIAGAAPHTITATAAYTTLTATNGGSTVIDASTQPLNGGDATKRRIELVGATTFDCFTVNAPNFELYGFYIHGYKDGVVFANGAADNFIIGSTVANKGNVISGNNVYGIYSKLVFGQEITGGAIINNYIGLREDGVTAQANVSHGIFFDDRINDITISDNVISSNGGAGIYIDKSISASTVGSYIVSDNIIGLDYTGTVARGNTTYGLFFDFPAIWSFNQITGNVVSSNGSVGMSLSGKTENTLIDDNKIGTDITGTLKRANTSHGLVLTHSTAATISASDTISNNIISNNTGDGLRFEQKVDLSIVRNNHIGVDVTGAVAMGNLGNGFHNEGDACQNVIIDSNIISNSGGYGIFMAGTSNREDQILYNKIGTDITGKVGMGNGLDGIRFGGNTLDDSKIKGNVISGNTGNGITFDVPDCDSDTITGNYIGVDITGSTALKNGGHGMAVINLKFRSAIVGGPNTEDGNVISANDGSGIYFSSNTGQSRSNVFEGNHIGVGVYGVTALGNGGHGILIESTVTGSEAFHLNDFLCNTIAYNTNEGIEFSAVTENFRNKIAGNSIYCNAQAGTQKGIEINGTAQANTAAPVITTANSTSVSGTAPNGATVEIFMSNPSLCGGSQAEYYVDNVLADGSGNWAYTVTAPITQISGNITAVAIHSLDNTSEISAVHSLGGFSLVNIPARCSSPVILPVELASFAANCNGANTVEIAWTTLSEINNDYFTIEKSKDAINFIEVIEISGIGNSNVLQSYSFVDESNDGYQYYRLKQTDFNGQYKYFKIVATEDCGEENNIVIYPNPANDAINLNVTGNTAPFNVQIFSSIGQLMIEKKFNAVSENTQHTIETTDLSAGVYFVNFYQGNFRSVQKLVIE